MVLVIDRNHDERIRIEKDIKSAYPDQAVLAVSSTDEALKLLSSEQIDVCFMEAVNKKVSCATLVDKLRRMKQDVKINFLADTGEYALMAWQLHINDYLVRPITIESVMHAKEKAESVVF